MLMDEEHEVGLDLKRRSPDFDLLWVLLWRSHPVIELQHSVGSILIVCNCCYVVIVGFTVSVRAAMSYDMDYWP